jgi:hypothetical protein
MRLVGSHAAVLTRPSRPPSCVTWASAASLRRPAAEALTLKSTGRAFLPHAAGPQCQAHRPPTALAADGWTTIILDRRGPYCHPRIHENENQVSVRGSPFPLRYGSSPCGPVHEAPTLIPHRHPDIDTIWRRFVSTHGHLTGDLDQRGPPYR